MPKVKKTQENPYGLSPKQLLVIEDMVKGVEAGGSITPVESTEKIYAVKSKTNASKISSRNMNDPDFRTALVVKMGGGSLYFGDDPEIHAQLKEGLYAVKKRPEVIDHDAKGRPVYVYVDDPDYQTRLKFIQELNKIAGVYAPERKETRTVSMKVNLSEEEVDKKIIELQEQLGT